MISERPRPPRVYAIDGMVPVVDPSSFVHPTAVLIGDVIIGANCYVGPGAAMRGDFGRLVMQDGSNLQDNCVVHGFPDTDTVLEVDAHIGHGAILHGCTIKRDALVGMNAVVMDGAVVGECAIVAAMAFVKAGFVVPPRTLVAGIPAKILREVTDKEIEWKRGGTRDYQNLTKRSLATLVECDALAAPEPDRKRLSLKGISEPLYKTRST
jgi:phenylacetic acid degradation protein